jgi:Type II secretory pathway, ATPase PulE/Tfp pilus assembly pathway, ATPase PilB
VLVRSFSQLGFSKEDYQHWQAMTAHTHGIVFVTGPTRLGQDHHALFHPQAAGHQRSERLHHRGPD